MIFNTDKVSNYRILGDSMILSFRDVAHRILYIDIVI